MGLRRVIVVGLLRQAPNPFPVARAAVLRRFDLADIIAQGAITAGCLAKLDRELSEQVLLLEITARGRDLVAQRLGKREVLKQRDDIGERLVEGKDIRIGRFAESAVDAVQQGVRGLVGDDIVRNRREDDAAFH